MTSDKFEDNLYVTRNIFLNLLKIQNATTT